MNKIQNQTTNTQQQNNVRECFVLAKRANITHEEWLNMRRNAISGTDASKIMGMNKFSSPMKLYMEKTGIISDHVETNAKMAFGIRMEKILLGWYAEDSGNEVIEVPAVLANRERPWMIADVDGIVYERDELGNKIPGVIEIKTSTYGDELADNGVNPMWYCQVMHYLAVTGCSFGILYALVNNEVHTIRIERNEAVIETIIAKEEEFFRALQEKNLPAVQAFDNTLMQQLFPVAKSTSIELSEDYLELLDDLESIKAQQTELEKKKDLIEAKIKTAIGENEVAECGQFKISWKNTTRNTLDTAVVKTLLTEEQLSKCLKTSTCRTFRISKTKTTKRK